MPPRSALRSDLALVEDRHGDGGDDRCDDIGLGTALNFGLVRQRDAMAQVMRCQEPDVVGQDVVAAVASAYARDNAVRAMPPRGEEPTEISGLVRVAQTSLTWAIVIAASLSMLAAFPRAR